jgi:NAD+ synthase (glutamine-hydrolysing)
MNIQLAQISPIVGDIVGNAQKVIDLSFNAFEQQVDCLVFCELFLTGYPPEDLLLRDDFINQVEKSMQDICQKSANIPIVLGSILREGKRLYNVAVLLQNKKIAGVYKKQVLPNYGVFDELRYFNVGTKPFIFKLKNKNIGLLICEDIWHQTPIKQSCELGADLIISIHASPFSINKNEERIAIVKQQALKHKVDIIYLNNVGGQDELVFDGGSFVMNKEGKITAQYPFFKQTTKAIISTNNDSTGSLAIIYNALVLATKDYIQNNGFNGVLIGLSGGIDSALVLAIAVDAIGAKHVETVMMPSPFTAQESIDEALQQTKTMGIKHHQIDIKPMMASFKTALSESFKNSKEDTTEENIQARIRGILLMGLSNKFNKIVLTTGNKSEMAVGYATLYGDMAGGFAPIKDVPKTLVYQLAKFRNTIEAIIPEFVITRPPSAELRANQTDSQSLPYYDILDEILRLFIEKRKSIEDIIKLGFDKKTVQKMIKLVLQNEHKRRQSPSGPKITNNAFGRERRYPITSKYIP